MFRCAQHDRVSLVILSDSEKSDSILYLEHIWNRMFRCSNITITTVILNDSEESYSILSLEHIGNRMFRCAQHDNNNCHSER